MRKNWEPSALPQVASFRRESGRSRFPSVPLQRGPARGEDLLGASQWGEGGSVEAGHLLGGHELTHGHFRSLPSSRPSASGPRDPDLPAPGRSPSPQFRLPFTAARCRPPFSRAPRRGHSVRPQHAHPSSPPAAGPAPCNPLLTRRPRLPAPTGPPPSRAGGEGQHNAGAPQPATSTIFSGSPFSPGSPFSLLNDESCSYGCHSV